MMSKGDPGSNDERKKTITQPPSGVATQPEGSEDIVDEESGPRPSKSGVQSFLVARTRHALVVSLDEARAAARALGPPWEIVEGYLLDGLDARRIGWWEQRSPAFAHVLQVLRPVEASDPPDQRPPLDSGRAPQWLLDPPPAGEPRDGSKPR